MNKLTYLAPLMIACSLAALPAHAEKADREKPINLDEPVVDTPKTISNSQRSYDSIIEHFSKMIAILTTEPSYVPNENDLKILIPKRKGKRYE